MIGCGAPSGALPLAEARSGKALLQVQVTHSEVYLRAAAARLQLCGSPWELRVSASSRLHATFPFFPEAGLGRGVGGLAGGRGGIEGEKLTGKKATPATTRDCGSNGRTKES